MSILQGVKSFTGRGSRRRSIAAGVTTVAAVGLTLGFAGPASANSQPVYYDGTFISVQQGTCLDIRPGTNLVYESGCVPGDVWQNWSVALADGGDGTNLITNDATGECLDVVPGTWNGTTGELYISQCVPGDEWQQWLTYGDGTNNGFNIWSLQNVTTGGCLDSNAPGQDPYINSNCYYASYQDWQLQSTS